MATDAMKKHLTPNELALLKAANTRWALRPVWGEQVRAILLSLARERAAVEWLSTMMENCANGQCGGPGFTSAEMISAARARAAEEVADV